MIEGPDYYLQLRLWRSCNGIRQTLYRRRLDELTQAVLDLIGDLTVDLNPLTDFSTSEACSPGSSPRRATGTRLLLGSRIFSRFFRPSTYVGTALLGIGELNSPTFQALPVKTTRSVAVHLSDMVTIANTFDRILPSFPQSCSLAMLKSWRSTINPTTVSGSRWRRGSLRSG